MGAAGCTASLRACSPGAGRPTCTALLHRTEELPVLRVQVIKVWDMSGKLLAGPVTLTDFFGSQHSSGRFSNAFCAQFLLASLGPCHCHCCSACHMSLSRREGPVCCCLETSTVHARQLMSARW